MKISVGVWLSQTLPGRQERALEAHCDHSHWLVFVEDLLQGGIGTGQTATDEEWLSFDWSSIGRRYDIEFEYGRLSGSFATVDRERQVHAKQFTKCLLSSHRVLKSTNSVASQIGRWGQVLSDHHH